jgi:nucleotidyltransferase/DNA polymerase involved in DNA repair
MPSLSDDPAVVYLDLGRTHSRYAQPLARSMHQAVILGLQIRPAIGLASGRFPAWVGALSLDPGMAAVIPRQLEADFLADYPVELLPVDSETLRQFHLLGLRRLGQVAALPAAAMLDRFGKPGQTLHRLAQGIDRRAVLPYTAQIIEQAAHSFDVPVVDQLIVERVLAELVGTLAGKLSKQGRLARDLDLQITLDNQRVLEQAIILRQPTANAGHISRSAGALLSRMPVNRPVTGLQISLTGITPVGARQLSLFEREPLQREELQAVLRDLSAKFGADCFYRVELADPAARLPEQRYHFKQAVDE